MTKDIKQYVPVFLSSTKEDLIPYRKAVIDTLNKMKVAIKGMEVFGARTEKPLEACLSEVSKSQYFIGIIGMRYGSLVETTGKSIVQSEYEKAVEESLKILIYLINEKKVSHYPPVFVDQDENAKKLENFKEKLRNNHMVEFFESSKDLATKVERDLLRVFSEKGIEIEKERLKPTIESKKTIELLRKFDLMPDRFKGSEIELIIKFSGEPHSVPKELCQAIGLKFGHSLSRSIITILQRFQANSTFFNTYMLSMMGAISYIIHLMIKRLRLSQDLRLVMRELLFFNHSRALAYLALRPKFMNNIMNLIVL